MSTLRTGFSLLALLPAMAAVQASAAPVLALALCGGGTLSVPVDGQGTPGQSQSPCCAKGCHSGNSRKRLDRTQ